MKLKKLKNIIKKVSGNLNWLVVDEFTDRNVVEIISCQQTKTHIIYQPKNPKLDNPLRDIEYLHELGHATLCETIHPVFSTHYFAIGTSDDAISMLTPVIRCACDWFVDEWLMGICPELEQAEIDEHYSVIIRIMNKLEFNTLVPDEFYSFALILAQGVKYLRKPNNFSNYYKETVNTFLSVKSNKPTVIEFENLINGLSSIFYPIRVRHIFDGEYDVWETYER